MTDAEINIAVAEACGWTDIVFRGIQKPQAFDFIGVDELHKPQGIPGRWSKRIPNYCADLNAMHEAEKTLDANPDEHLSGRYQYADWVYRIVVPVNVQPFRATARQRAEAFLRTVGKWKEGE